MAGDSYLIRDGPVAVPLAYQVPQSGELLPLSVRATLNGASSGQPYFAVVQLVAPSGRILGNYITEPIAAGAAADVTWFPGAELDQEQSSSSGSGTGTGSGDTATPLQVTDGSNTVTDVVDIDFVSGATVSSGGAGVANVTAVGSGTPSFSGARIYRSTNQSIPNNTDTVTVFDTVRFDVGGYSNIATHPSRLTAPVTGYYLIGGTIAFPVGDFYTQCVILINGSLVTGQIAATTTSVPGGGNANLVTNVVWKMTAGDYAELNVVQASGGAANLLSAPPQSPEFWISLLGV